MNHHSVGGEKVGFPIDTNPIECSLSDLGEIRLEMVSGSSLEPLWNTLVREYHYLGHQRIFERLLKYLTFVHSRPIAALGWITASIRLEARDCFIGWSKEQQKKYLKHVVNNNRFLIPNWIRIKNLASYLLARGIKAVTRDRHEKYGQNFLFIFNLRDFLCG